MRINREADGSTHDTLSINGDGCELQLYILNYKGRPVSLELYFMDSDEHEWTITPGENERMEFLEALRNWSNDQIWRLQHEEAAA